MKHILFVVVLTFIFSLTACSKEDNLNELQELSMTYSIEYFMPSPSGDGYARCDIVNEEATCYNTNDNTEILLFSLDLGELADNDFDYSLYYFPFLYLNSKYLNKDMTEIKNDKLDDFLLSMTNDSNLKEELTNELKEMGEVTLYEFVFKEGRLVKFTFLDDGIPEFVGEIIYND